MRPAERVRGSAQGGCEGDAGGEVAAHAVDAAAGRRGGGAEVETFGGGGVGCEARYGPGEELPEVHDTAVYVATYEVGVGALQIRSAHRASGQDEVLKTGGEALYLIFYALCHVEGGAVRDVAVSPDGVFSFGGARPVEEALLGEQDERALGMFPPPDGGFSMRNLLQRAAQVDGSGPPVRSGLPGDRTVEREVHLEDAGAVPVAIEGLSVMIREVLPCDLKQLARRYVEEHRAGPGHLLYGTDADTCIYLTA